MPGNKDIWKLFILLVQLFQLNLSNKVYSLKRTRKGRRAGGGGEWVTGTEGGLDGMRTGCYSVC